MSDIPAELRRQMAEWGKRGGQATSKRGPEYYRQLQAKSAAKRRLNRPSTPEQP